MILIASKHWARNRPGDTLDVSAKEGANLLERGLARNASIGEAFVFAVTSAWQATLAVLHSEEAVSQIRAAAAPGRELHASNGRGSRGRRRTGGRERDSRKGDRERHVAAAENRDVNSDTQPARRPAPGRPLLEKSTSS